MTTKDLSRSEIDKFLKELTELSHKHRIEIGGCGCCGSPWLMKHNDPYSYKYNYDSSKVMGDGLQWEDE